MRTWVATWARSAAMGAEPEPQLSSSTWDSAISLAVTLWPASPTTTTSSSCASWQSSSSSAGSIRVASAAPGSRSERTSSPSGDWVNTTAIKLLAFGVGAFFAGGAGSIYTHLNSQASPDSFQFIQSVTVLAMVVLGGMGNLGGVILGAVILVVMPKKLRFFQDQRLLLFGAALILMIRSGP
jgi:branched-subunit amino acid transport system permease